MENDGPGADMMSDTLSTINIDQLTSSAMGAFNQHVHQIDLATSVSSNGKTDDNVGAKSTLNNLTASYPVSVPSVPLMLSVSLPSQLPGAPFQGTLPPILPLIHQSGLHTMRQLISPVNSLVTPGTIVSSKQFSGNGNKTAMCSKPRVGNEAELTNSRLKPEIPTDTCKLRENFDSYEHVPVSQDSSVTLEATPAEISNIQKPSNSLLSGAAQNINMISLDPSSAHSPPAISEPLPQIPVSSTHNDLQPFVTNVSLPSSLYPNDSIYTLYLQQLLNGPLENQHLLNISLSTQNPSEKGNVLNSNQENLMLNDDHLTGGKKTREECSNSEDGDSEEEHQLNLQSQGSDHGSSQVNTIPEDTGMDMGNVETTLISLPEPAQLGTGEPPTDGVVFTGGGLDLLSLQSQLGPNLLGPYLQSGTDLGDLACNGGNVLDVMCSTVRDSNGTEDIHLPGSDNQERETQIDQSIYQYFCAVCNTALSSSCPQHTARDHHVMDTPNLILSKARISLPKCLYLKPTNSSRAVEVPVGVFAYKTIGCNTKFGPFVAKSIEQGEKKPKVPSFPEWKISENDKLTTLVADDEEACNWMMFVRIARTAEKINMLAHQIGRHIYFFASRTIQEDEELIVWFSKHYSKSIGLPLSPSTAKICECLNCGSLYKSKTQLHSHLWHAHGIVKPDKWKCDNCNRVFRSQTGLDEHSRVCELENTQISGTGTTGEGKHCRFCKKVFKDPSNLKMHIKIHFDEKTFKCSTCDKRFRQKIHLQVHMATHNTDKQFKCTYCPKLFARKADCRTHEKWHQPEKGMRCEYCYKLFYKTQNFKRHQLIHTGKKDFECEKCSKCFYTKEHMKRHFMTCKGEKPYLYNLNEKIDLQQVHNDYLDAPVM